VRRGQPRDLLNERASPAASGAAEEPAYPQPDQHRYPGQRRIAQAAQVAAMNAGGHRSTARTRRRRRCRTSGQHDAAGHPLDPIDAHMPQVR